MNVVLECFNDEFVDKVESNWVEGTGLIVIATEFLTGDTFNNIYQSESSSHARTDQNVRQEFWQMRFRNFSRLSPHFKAIWHPAEDQVPGYKELLPTLPVLYMPHVYSERFATVKHRPDDQKDIDVLFTGTLTEYRREVLSALVDKGVKVATSVLFTAPFHREDLVSRSKLILNIKQHYDWKHESVGRLYYHLCNDSLLLTEKCSFPTDLHKYVCEIKEGWLDSVMYQLDAGDFTNRAIELRKAFSQERPIGQVFSQLLCDSGVVG